ncbi:T9SS type A sorting domain-containing protein [Taibaiella lutea]|uniref:T9SS type A sorting domain-containing protein n=1 Tax=Taibaiella lutea TaxID=2608001 RepID=A0A5M6CQ02_9BACT|nr:T9SS type A sorting domain-containing protein [Taibaiella lutea]KAA5537244.1 T9SS type A sorting domain-containing protein [Taibaiella lutea]
MKKIYLLGLALTMISMANAQTTVIDDGFESYNIGSLYGGNWSNWQLADDETLNMMVSDVRASPGGTKSGYVGPHNDGNGQDALLKMPSVYTHGKITAEWKMFVPADSVAYYNLQEQATPGGSFGFQCYINTYAATDTLPGGESLAHKLVWTFAVDTVGYLYAYAPLVTDQWFTLKQVMDLDNLTLSLYVDGTEVVYFQPQVGNDWPGAKKSVAAFDFFSYQDEDNPDLVNTYYIDDIKVTTENVSGINNVEKNSSIVSLYPNPGKDYISFSVKDEVINNIDVFNVFGQKVLNANAKTSLSKLDIRSLASGIYTAKVTTKNGIFTKKFVVK